MTKEAAFSLADLNATKACDVPIEVELPGPDGMGTGVFLMVLGDQSATVQAAQNKIIDERKKQEANLAAFTGSEDMPTEANIEFLARLTACKLVGWRGIKEPWTPENGLILIRTNRDAAKLVNDTAKRTADFLPLKPKA